MRQQIVIRAEEDYERARDRARELHAGSEGALAELELESLAVAMLAWELRRGEPQD
jgi:hypothetical protein